MGDKDLLTCSSFEFTHSVIQTRLELAIFAFLFFLSILNYRPVSPALSFINCFDNSHSNFISSVGVQSLIITIPEHIRTKSWCISEMGVGRWVQWERSLV